jgi:hypothetical protein
MTAADCKNEITPAMVYSGCLAKNAAAGGTVAISNKKKKKTS